MIIYSFDCGTRKLGFCCIEVNTNWRNELAVEIKSLRNIYKNSIDLSEIKKALGKIEKLLDTMFKIVYMNVFDLLPNEPINAANHTKVVQNVKYLLNCLSHQLPKPDTVLIEFQMKKNGKTNKISDYLEMYYMPLGDDSCITYMLDEYPIDDSKVVASSSTKPAVHLIGCSLKNSHSIDKIGGKYQKFLLRYNDNYTANKEHCNYNFKYFLSAWNINISTKDSTRDIADAFMQAFAWCIKQQYI